MAIHLTSTSDLVRVTTSSGADVDIHASWVDVASGVTTPGHTNVNMTTATTTTVVGSPGASTQRTVRTLHIRNKDVIDQDVTVIHTDGTNAPEMVKAVSLTPGRTLDYDEGAGWQIRDAFGRIITRLDGELAPATTGMTVVVQSADVSNAEAVPDTLTNVTGLLFSVTSGVVYYFRFDIHATSAANATGSRWVINGPTVTSLYTRSEYTATATTRTFNEGLAAIQLPAASNAGSIAAGFNAIVEGFITPSANGTVQLQFASEVTLSAVTSKAGSILQWAAIA